MWLADGNLDPNSGAVAYIVTFENFDGTRGTKRTKPLTADERPSLDEAYVALQESGTPVRRILSIEPQIAIPNTPAVRRRRVGAAIFLVLAIIVAGTLYLVFGGEESTQDKISRCIDEQMKESASSWPNIPHGTQFYFADTYCTDLYTPTETGASKSN